MKKTALITVVSATICVLSQIIASSDSIVGTGWDALGRAIWITILITLPAFAIFCVFACLYLIMLGKKLAKKRTY